MKKYGNEFKVGLFFLICVFGLAAITIRTNKVNFKKKGYHIYVIFEDISGLEKEASVLLNGVDAGKVENIESVYIADKTKVKLTVYLNNGVEIRENPKISIKSIGFMGEQCLQISSLEGKKLVNPGALIKGEPCTDIGTIMKNVDNLTKQVNELTSNLNYVVEDSKNTISQMVLNLESASKNLEEFTLDIKKHPWKLLYKNKEEKEKEKSPKDT